MTITVTNEITEYSIFNELWSGGRSTLDNLTVKEVETILCYLDEMNAGEPMTLTELNDFFWFNRDEIALLLGYENYDELMNREV